MKMVKDLNGKARLVGVNHVALEVGNIEEALGDQFIALSESRTQPPDKERHFGLVVDDKEKVRQKLKEAGAKILPGRGVEFRDPWGNRVQIVEYANIQFTKDKAVLEGMGCEGLRKSSEAIAELARKGMVVKEG